jgi:hypothetical protein
LKQKAAGKRKKITMIGDDSMETFETASTEPQYFIDGNKVLSLFDIQRVINLLGMIVTQSQVDQFELHDLVDKSRFANSRMSMIKAIMEHGVDTFSLMGKTDGEITAMYVQVLAHRKAVQDAKKLIEAATMTADEARREMGKVYETQPTDHKTDIGSAGETNS